MCHSYIIKLPTYEDIEHAKISSRQLFKYTRQAASKRCALVFSFP